jgi:hypothetical protein
MKWPHATLSQAVRIRLLAFVTIAVTAVISFSSLRNLADRAGFHDLAWLFPVCLDAVAALGVELWLSRSPARGQAATLALSAISLSTAGNVYDWGIRSQLWAVPDWLAPALGSIPPVGLAALLLVLHCHGRSTPGPVAPRHEPSATETGSLQTSRGLGDQSAPMTNVVPVPPPVDLQLAPSPGVENSSTAPRSASARSTRVPRKANGASAKQSDLEMIETIRQMEAAGTTFSRRGAMAQFGVGSAKATQLITAARNGQEQDQ